MEEARRVWISKEMEDEKLTELFHALNREFEDQFRAEHHLLISRGHGSSGAALQVYIKLCHEQATKFVGKAVEIRRETAARVPELAEPHEIRRWQKIVEERLEVIFKKRPDFLGLSSAGSDAVTVEVQTRMENNQSITISELQSKLHTLETEAFLPSPQPSGGVHITAHGGSIVAGHNIIGSSLSTNNQASQQNPELVRLLTQLIQEVRTSTDLDDTDKRKSLESLQFITEQVSAQPEERQNAIVIEGVWKHLPGLLGAASNLVTIYGAVSPHIMEFLSHLGHQ